MRRAIRVAACGGVLIGLVGLAGGCPGAAPVPIGESETKDYSGFARFQLFGVRPACAGRVASAEIRVEGGVYTLTSAVWVRAADAATGLGPCDDPGSLEIGAEISRALSADEIAEVKQVFAAVVVQEYDVPMTPLCGEVSFQGVVWDSFSYAVPATCVNRWGLAPNAMERFGVIEEMILGLRD